MLCAYYVNFASLKTNNFVYETMPKLYKRKGFSLVLVFGGELLNFSEELLD